MIETLMALWNRGVSGRLMVMVVTFFCLCISISLLFVTVGSVWGSLLAHGRPGGGETRVSNPVVITATAPSSTAPPSTATAQVEVTPVITPNPCLASPTGGRGNTPLVVATRNRGRSGVPTRTATARPLRRKPTPGSTITPEPSPTVSPTLPAVTPTVTTQPTITATVTSTPGNTPTVAASPTDTSTPGGTPTPTPTVPGSTPTIGITPTATDTPTVTAPSGSPTVMVTATGGLNSRQVHDGRPQGQITPSGANSGQPSEGSCLGDILLAGGESALLARLQNFLWIILVSSLLGTTLFCRQMYRLSRNFHRRSF